MRILGARVERFGSSQNVSSVRVSPLLPTTCRLLPCGRPAGDDEARDNDER